MVFFDEIIFKVRQDARVIHQIRNSKKYGSYKGNRAVMTDLKRVYGAPALDDAAYRLEAFREKWGKKYSQILRSCPP